MSKEVGNKPFHESVVDIINQVVVMSSPEISGLLLSQLCNLIDRTDIPKGESRPILEALRAKLEQLPDLSPQDCEFVDLTIHRLMIREAHLIASEEPPVSVRQDHGGDLLLRERRLMMSFDLLTNQARAVLETANRVALMKGQNELRVEHVLVGVLSEGGSASATVLGKLGLTSQQVSAEIGAMLPSAVEETSRIRHLPHSHGVRRMLEHALDQAHVFTRDQIGVDDLFFVLLQPGNKVAEILGQCGFKPQDVRAAMRAVRFPQATSVSPAV